MCRKNIQQKNSKVWSSKVTECWDWRILVESYKSDGPEDLIVKTNCIKGEF